MTVAWEAEKAIEHMEPVADAGKTVARGIHDLVLKGGEPTRKFVDFLHGTWLGHPLHPVLTDITIGAWTIGTLFDAAAAITGDSDLETAADKAIEVGTASAIPTAITGMADYSTIPKDAAAHATLHAALNIVNFALYAGSVQARRSGNRRRGTLLSTIGFGLTCVSAWIGGSLVYTYKIGTDHSDKFTKPKRFTPVMDAAKLPDRKPVRVDYDDKPVMVYRDGEQIYALGARCPHDAGPLDEGKIEGSCVECPWHQSVFDMRDGHIVHGPACQPPQAFDARIQDGKVQLRAQEKPGPREA
jgi:nitrite reductase/ring-hydroxylating ferredoxin subunit/uncharacterized membrane protein